MIRKVYQSEQEFKAQNEALGNLLPYSSNTDILNSEISADKKHYANRFVCQPMEGCDGTSDGRPDELTKRRYERFAKGGAGLIWFEATAVQNVARANPRQLFINDNTLDSFKEIVHNIKETCIRENGFEPIVIMQATHSGRYSKPEGTPAPLIAYNNPIFEKDSPISPDRILSDDEIDTVGEDLIKGAVLAEKAGFDGVDIKCCHRYLNSELLSAYNRAGKYGGSLKNRTRLLRESVQGAISATSSDFTVTTRLNVYDGFEYPYGFGVPKEGGLDFDMSEPLWLLKELNSYGVELVNITMGNPYFNPHVNRPFAVGGYTADEHPLQGVARVLNGTAQLKAQLPQMKIICSALSFLGVAAPNVAAAYIKENKFDFAGFGRTVFAYPDFANDIKNQGELCRDKLCIACSKCTEIMRAGGTPGCVIRDKEIYLPLYKEYCSK